jgi:hypothetical protein
LNASIKAAIDALPPNSIILFSNSGNKKVKDP